MKKQIYDEKNGLNNTLHGDYYLPDLEINEEEPTYGKYGIMRKQFLKEHRSARYQYLVLTGKLTEHLNQVDKEVREKVEILMEQMAEQWGVTEELKMQDQTDDLEQYVKDVTLSEMTRVICMDQLAEQKEITLSKEEKTNLKLAAKEYYESLNEEEKKQTDPMNMSCA